jgi:hypothetical protein
MVFSMIGCLRPSRRFSHYRGLLGLFLICLLPSQVAALD